MSTSPESLKKRALEETLFRRGENREALALGVVLALTATGEFGLLKLLLKSMLEKKLQPGSILEILLQAHLFSGFPRAIRGLMIFHELLRPACPEKTPKPPREDDPPVGDRWARGRALFDRVYGKNSAAVLDSLHRLHPSYDIWILEDAYGRVLARPGLPGKTRELCAVAALTVSNVPKQLRSHIMGAINLGASVKEVEESISSVRVLAGDKKIHDALEILASLELK